MISPHYRERLDKCSIWWKRQDLMLYCSRNLPTCSIWRETAFMYLCHDHKGRKVALGVPQTDVEDVKQFAHFDQIVVWGWSWYDPFHRPLLWAFWNQERTVGLEYTFLTQSMMGMMTHPHAKPEQVAAKDCTHIMSEMRIVKDEDEIKRISASAKVADAGMKLLWKRSNRV